MKNGTVLVLNSRNGWLPAMLVTSEGEQEELSCFQPDDNTQAWSVFVNQQKCKQKKGKILKCKIYIS